MKTILVALALAAALLTGCTTTRDGVVTTRTVDTVKMSNVVFLASQTGVSVAVRKAPENSIYFRTTLSILDAVIANGTTDPQEILRALSALGLGVEDADVATAITSGFSLYQIYFGDVVAARVDRVQNLRPILESFRAGIRSGLALASAFGEPGRVCEHEDMEWTEPGWCAAPYPTVVLLGTNKNSFGTVTNPPLARAKTITTVTNIVWVTNDAMQTPTKGQVIPVQFAETNRTLGGLPTLYPAVRVFAHIPTNTTWRMQMQTDADSPDDWTTLPYAVHRNGGIECLVTNTRKLPYGLRFRAVFVANAPPQEF
jgi:hypothetical protein